MSVSEQSATVDAERVGVTDSQPIQACECWAEDHPWTVDGACDLSAVRRVNVRLNCTNCPEDDGPHNEMFLFCEPCARDVLSDLPPGVLSAHDIGPLA